MTDTLQQGLQQQAEETAVKMINKNYPDSEIVEMTGLPLAQVLALKEKIPAKASTVKA